MDKLLFEKTNKQKEALKLLGGYRRHVLLYGGSRSGKTFILLYALIWRALKHKSRHLIVRKHFNHVKQSIWYDTLPKVLEVCFPPGIRETITLDKSDWFMKFSNGSEVWFGGLDDKERTEKILGKEYSTIFFNECSQISYDSRNIALTRLAERNLLKKKIYYDCNPPKRNHWTHSIFVDLEDPITNKRHQDVKKFGHMQMNPTDNLDNIDPEYISDILERLPPKLRQRFLHGEFGTDDTDVIRSEWISPPDKPLIDSEIAAKFTLVDPATTEKERATDNTCESAIVTIGVGYNGIIEDIEVESGFWGYKELKDKCHATAKRHKSCPSYFLGSEEVAAQRWLIEDLNREGTTCVGVKPDNDKVRRAISVTDLMEQGRCRINNDKLRKQLLGFPGEKLKDLVDAYVYALRMVKVYGQEHYEKKEDKYKHLDARSKMFWKMHDKAFDGSQGNTTEELMKILEL